MQEVLVLRQDFMNTCNMCMILVILAASITWVDGATSGLCKEDQDCPAGYYCTSLNRCGPCLDCTDYNRQYKDSNRCPKEWKDCGPCLPGFHEETITKNRVSEFCTEPDGQRWENSIVFNPSNVIIHKSGGTPSGPFLNLGIIVTTMSFIVISGTALYIFVLKPQLATRRGANPG